MNPIVVAFVVGGEVSVLLWMITIYVIYGNEAEDVPDRKGAMLLIIVSIAVGSIIFIGSVFIKIFTASQGG